MTTFDYRRRLERNEVLKLAGACAAVGSAIAGVGFYLGRLWMQRVPLKPGGRVPEPPPHAGTLPAMRRLSADVHYDTRERG